MVNNCEYEDRFKLEKSRLEFELNEFAGYIAGTTVGSL